MKILYCYMLTCNEDLTNLHVVYQIIYSHSLKPVSCVVFKRFPLTCHVVKFYQVFAGSQAIGYPGGRPVELRNKCLFTASMQPQGKVNNTTHLYVPRGRTIPRKVCSTWPDCCRRRRQLLCWHLTIVVRKALRQWLRATVSHCTRQGHGCQFWPQGLCRACLVTNACCVLPTTRNADECGVP